ncbi:MAG: hypothetical protein LC749_16100, partial [Actinobacteria bacterium]|nr:hypothetical protein [Actinomycetota bacterium]
IPVRIFFSLSSGAHRMRVIIDGLRGGDYPRDLRIDLRLSANRGGAGNKYRERDASDQTASSRKMDSHLLTTHKISAGEKPFCNCMPSSYPPGKFSLWAREMRDKL